MQHFFQCLCPLPDSFTNSTAAYVPLFIKTILRNCPKNKTYTLLNMMGLDIGIACAGLIFLWVEGEMSYDSQHVKKDAYTAEQRMKEIGVRKVLGATVSNIAGLLSKEFLQLVLIACAVAFPVAWIMHDWIRSYEYRVDIS